VAVRKVEADILSSFKYIEEVLKENINTKVSY
jgi:hypothetical protein